MGALGIIVLLHLFVLSRLSFFPYPELFILPYLTHKGLLPYQQIMDQHFPGLMYFPINLTSLGIDTVTEMRFLHLGLVALSQILLFLVAKKLFQSQKWALLTNFLYFLWQPFYEGNVLWIESFVVPLLLGSLYFLSGEKPNSRKLFISGFFLGLALVFKQTVAPLGILLAIYLFSKLKDKKDLCWFGLGGIIPAALMLLYFIKIGVWQDFYFWTYEFNLGLFAEMARKYPTLADFVRLAPIFGLAGLLMIFGWLKRKNWEVVLLSLFFIGSLAFAYARIDYIHLQPALPSALLLILWFGRGAKRMRLPLIVFTVFFLWFLMPGFYQWNWGGEVKFFGEEEKRIAEAVGEYSQDNDSVFSFASLPHLNYLTNTLPPGRVYVFQFPWFMLSAEEKIFSGIINDPPKVVVRDQTATTGGMNLIEYMPKINQYLEKNYQTIEIVGNNEIMIPKDYENRH